MITIKRRSILFLLFPFLATLLLTSDLWAQSSPFQRKFRHMTRGKVWHTYRNGLTGRVHRQVMRDIAGMQYPGSIIPLEPTEFEQYWSFVSYHWYPRFTRRYDTSRGEGVMILTRDHGTSAVGPSQESEDIREKVYDIVNSPEKDLGFMTASHFSGFSPMSNYWPGAPPIVGEPVEIHNHDYGRYIGDDSQGEEILITAWSSKTGISVSQKAFSWSYPDFDDFIIYEYTFHNNGDANGDGQPDSGMPVQLNDVYFAFVNVMTISQAGCFISSPGAWWVDFPELIDDFYRYTGAANYDGPAEYADLKLSYHYDGDAPSTLWNDVGGPYVSARHHSLFKDTARIDGELTDFQYFGFAPLDYTPPFTNDSENYVAPKVADQPVSVKWWEILGRNNFTYPDPSNDGDAQLWNKLVEGQGIQSNPIDIGNYVHSHTYGPYDIGPGEKVKIVAVFAGGTAADARGMGIMEWAQTGNQDEISLGREALVDHVRRAQFAYDSGYDLPDPPPDVRFSAGNSERGQVLLTWPDDADRALDPDYGTADVRAYRVYRSETKEAGPYKLLKEISVGDAAHLSGGIYSFEDETSAPGFNYWYSVRSVDSGHSSWINNDGTKTLADLPDKVRQNVQSGMESGYSSPEQRMQVFTSPKIPATATKDNFGDEILVVPNPYRDDGTHRYPGSRKIRFTNIPRQAQIKIYSPSGDLIWTINHDSPLGEAEWNQAPRSFARPEVPSGIYFYSVESLVESSKGQIRFGSFVIIK